MATETKAVEARRLPCPFCGAQPDNDTPLNYLVHNRPCYIIAAPGQMEDGWNRRHADSTRTQLAEMKEALRAAQAVIEDMRSENKLHGHITDASSNYLHKVKPQIDALLSQEEG